MELADSPIKRETMTKTPVVTVEQGQLQGRMVNTPSGKPYYSFQGIPYAKPPLGPLRFKAPQPPEPWEGIRDATSEGSVSAQIDYIFGKVYVGDENCLFLNVYTPDLEAENLPVMFWIHGGGFRWGSGNTDLYGPDYLIEKGVVVVTINYRCGVLGFLCLDTPEVPGNAGLKDQIQALRWVKRNIHKFGGDPNNITVFGESAGGISTSILTASPLSKDLISKAIVESGCGESIYAFVTDPVGVGRKLAKHLGCQSDDIKEIQEFLMTTPVKDLVNTHEALNPFDKPLDNHVYFCCVVEKQFPGVEAVITEPFFDIITSGKTADIPIMVGRNALELIMDFNTDDLQLFVPGDLNIVRNSPESLAIAEQLKRIYFKDQTGAGNMIEGFQLLSDFHVNLDTHKYVKHLVQVSTKPVFYYIFDYFGKLNFPGNMFNQFQLEYAVHMDELGYLFKNDFQKDVKPTPQDLVTRERLVRLWTNFAKYGNPTPDKNDYITTTWLPVTKDKMCYFNIGYELSLCGYPDKMEFWDDLYKKYFKTSNKN